MVSHFKHLASHRLPVLHLYKHMLRLASCADCTTQVKYMFRSSRGLRSSYAAKRHIEEAFEWEKLLMGFVHHGSNHSLVEEKKAEVLAKVDRVRQATSSGVKPREKNTQHKKQPDRFLQYNEPKKGQRLAEMQHEHRMLTYRNRVVRKAQERNRLTTRRPLDEVYLDLIMVPEYRQKKEVKRLKKLYNRDARNYKLRLNYIKSPLGFFWYVRRPDKYQTKTVGAIIRKLMGDRSLEKYRAVEAQMTHARAEALWESYLEGVDLDTAKAQWTGPLTQTAKDIKQRRARVERKLDLYRDTLLQRIGVESASYEGKRDRRMARWANFVSPTIKMTRFTKL